MTTAQAEGSPPYVDISHVHTKHGVTAQTQVELHDNDRVFGDYTEGVMADFALSEEDYAWLAQYDIVHAAIWGHAEDAFPQLHAAGKLTAFDFSGQVQPASDTASRFCFARTARRRNAASEDESDCCPWRRNSDVTPRKNGSTARDGGPASGLRPALLTITMGRRFVHCRIPLRLVCGDDITAGDSAGNGVRGENHSVPRCLVGITLA